MVYEVYGTREDGLAAESLKELNRAPFLSIAFRILCSHLKEEELREVERRFSEASDAAKERRKEMEKGSGGLGGGAAASGPAPVAPESEEESDANLGSGQSAGPSGESPAKRVVSKIPFDKVKTIAFWGYGQEIIRLQQNLFKIAHVPYPDDHRVREKILSFTGVLVRDLFKLMQDEVEEVGPVLIQMPTSLIAGHTSRVGHRQVRRIPFQGKSSELVAAQRCITEKSWPSCPTGTLR